MTLALIITIGGLAILGTIAGARAFAALAWREALTAYRLRLPAKLTIDDVTRWLSMVAATTTAPQWSLLPTSPLELQVVATARGIEHYLLVPKSAEAKFLGSVRAGLPGARVEEAPEFVGEQPQFLAAGEFTATSRHRPLAVERAEATSTAFLESLQPLSGDNEVRLQVIMTSAGTPEPVHSASPNREDRWWAAYLMEGEPSADAEAVRALRDKRSQPLLHVSLRLGVSAPSRAQAWSLLHRTWGTLHGANAPGVRIVRRWLPPAVVATRMVKHALPVTVWPFLLGAHELSSLVALPTGASIFLPGLNLHAARQLPPPPNLARRNAISLGVSNYPGMSNRTITLAAEDRLRHMAVFAPTGAGKSWLLASMINDDIAAGRGVFVVDPKGDLVTDVLARINDRDAERVVVLDAARRDMPVGLNVLGQARDEASRELVVDNVLHVFRSIWSDFWGPRSDALLRMGLTLLTNGHGAEGSALTLAELVPLLTQPAFRRFLVGQPGVPDAVRAYWLRHDALSDGERQQVIAPILTKVEAFTSRTAIKLMVGQSCGVDLRSVFRDRSVVLVSLAKGTLGTETANLLGSLIISLFWQATLARVRVPAEKRHPVFAYIDEAADVMRLPVPLADMYSQARGLGLGVVTAMQYLSQAPESIRAALLGTVLTQLSFRVQHDDAVLLAKHFAPLTADDLTGLARYEVAMKPCVNGVTLPPLTMTTLPLGPVLRDADELAGASRQRYGVPRAEVEAVIKARIAPPGSTSGGAAFGRRSRGGRS
ncbi:DUF87 domain-containing protein [Amycolatopsis sp. NBC_01488]|uniref:helicase HerA domain-containing protein n=1 Tax=Amycolatopsis sp. NBC_01488 TaxID=2903563 RepID=UPI002E2C873D|nr:DUF87 domain-containing protein [Amycolatopsis sp. NBC_01488]